MSAITSDLRSNESFEIQSHFSLSVQTQFLRDIKNGTKTVEGRLNTEKYRNVTKGSILEFSSEDGESVSCEVTMVTEYATFREMLNTEGYKDCIPEAETVEVAVNTYYGFSNYKQKELDFGVVAFKLKVMK